MTLILDVEIKISQKSNKYDEYSFKETFKNTKTAIVDIRITLLA